MDRIAGGVGGGLLAVFNLLRRLASEEDVPVFLVGGPVRDSVLDVPPRDLDFVLVGDAPVLATDVADKLGGRVIAHSRFGTATVVVEGDHVDIVTARKESYHFPGSLPETSPSDLADDLARRDLSINAMALPLFGVAPNVIDPHGGLQDLANGSVSIMHPGSFTDDPTRMLRAVRYEQRLGFKIAESTLSDLQRSITEGHIAAVSGDRWRQEFQKIFAEDNAPQMLVRAMDLGILQGIHPAMTDGRSVTSLIGQSDVHSSHFLAALASGMSAVGGESVCERLNLPGDWARVVRDTIALQGLMSAISAPTAKTSEICRSLDGLETEAIEASARFTLEPLVSENLRRYLNEWRNVRPSLSGDDLLAMGVPSGSGIGEILREVHSAILDGLVSNEAEQRALVDEIISRGNWSPEMAE